MSQFIEMFGNPVTNSMKWPTKPISKVAPEQPSETKTKGSVWLLNLDMIESNTGKIIEKVYEDDSKLLSVAPFDEGNVLYSKLRPYLNKVVIPNGKGYATTELVPLRPNQELVNLTFFSHLLRGDDFVSYANGIATGTKMPRMPLNDLRKFNCILPPIEMQKEFEEIAYQADKSGFDELKSQFIEMFDFHELNLNSPSKDFESMCLDDTSSATKIPAAEYLQEGKYAVYDQAQEKDIAGYSNTEQGLCRNYPTVLFGDHSRVVKYINEPFFIGADGVKIIRPREDNLIPEFLYYDLKYHNIPNTGYNRHFKYIKMISLTKASLEEQSQFLSIAHQADKSGFELRKSIDAIDAVIKSLINS